MNGKEILTVLATRSNLTVYCADSKVFISVDPPEAYIKDGQIFYARPGDTVPNVYGSLKFPVTNSLALLELSYAQEEESLA